MLTKQDKVMGFDKYGGLKGNNIKISIIHTQKISDKEMSHRLFFN